MQIRHNHKTPSQLEQDEVIVSIWTSGHNLHIPGANVGHVSVYSKKDDLYLSLWPEGKSGGIKGKYNPYFNTFDEDLNDEGRKPEKVFKFYSLNTTKLKETYEQLRKNTTAWGLFGGLEKNKDSCVSAVWKALVAAGINRLIPKISSVSAISNESAYGSLNSTKGSVTSNPDLKADGSIYSTEQIISPIIKSPDALIAQLEIAKKNELKRYPESKAIEAKSLSLNQTQHRRRLI